MFASPRTVGLPARAGARAAARALPGLAALACVLALSAPACAQTKTGDKPPPVPLLKKVTPEQMADILTKAGYKSQVQGSGQQKTVSAQFFPGPPGKVMFAMCASDGCSLVEFVYDFGKLPDIGFDWVNAWNDQKPVTAVLREDGSLQMLMWTHLFGPVSAEHLAATARLFVDVVNTSTDFKPSQ